MLCAVPWFCMIEKYAYHTKCSAGIALRRRGIMSLKRPAAGVESCKQDSILQIG